MDEERKTIDETQRIMKVSEIMIQAMKRFEGCRLTAYKCPAGVWTIGYGHTAGVKSGDKISQRQADAWLREDLASFERGVERLCAGLTQGQFDALVDFAYNLGLGNLKSSTLLRKIKAGASETEIRYQFSRWNKAGGKVLPGLVKRRAWEADRFFAKV